MKISGRDWDNKPIKTAFSGKVKGNLYEVQIDVVIKNGVKECNVIDSITLDVYGNGMTVLSQEEISKELDRIILENCKAVLMSDTNKGICVLHEYSNQQQTSTIKG